MLPPRSYIEGIVRGYRNGLLTGTNYTNMTQCETIDGNRTLLDQRTWQTLTPIPCL